MVSAMFRLEDSFAAVSGLLSGLGSLADCLPVPASLCGPPEGGS